MNVFTLNKFINDFDEVFSQKVLQEVANIASSMSSTIQSINQRNNNAARVTLHELNTYSDRLNWLYLELEKMKLHLTLLLPDYDLNFINAQYEVLSNYRSETLELINSCQKFNQIAASANGSLGELSNKVNTVRNFIKPYLSAEEYESEDKAVVSILFNDRKTITSLKEFQKSLGKWNQVLPEYHRLVTGNSSEPVEIVTVQNGCIDLVVNLDVDVALDLTDVFKTAITAFCSYLALKKKLQVSVKGTTIDLDDATLKKAEENFLEEHKKAIYRRTLKTLEEQVHKSQKGGNNIKVISTITEVITTHVVQGNEYEILNLPHVAENVDEEEKSEAKENVEELKKLNRGYLELRDELTNDQRQELLSYHDSVIKELTEVTTTTKKAAKKATKQGKSS